MKKRPNPILHMMAWGAVSGFILAMSYLLIFIDLFNSYFRGNSLGLLIDPMFWIFAFFLGSVPGTMLGLIVGLNLWSAMRNVDLPFTKMDMQKKRWDVYSSTFLIILPTFFLFILSFGVRAHFFLLLLPPFIAAIASTYAAHRYMFRMRLWSGGIEGRKSKAKNDAQAVSRLAENETESEIMYQSSDKQSQSETRS